MRKYLAKSYIAAGFLLLNCTSSPYKEKVSFPPNVYHAAFLIMEGVYNTELTAPYDIFQHTKFRENIKPINVFTVASSKAPVTTFEGLRILPDYDYTTDALPPIDILVVPSAEHHVDTDLENRELIEFVQKAAQSAMLVTSHCDGAFILARAGLLDSVKSTTFPADIPKYKAMFPHLDVVEDVWFVHDGKFITSAGGARSFEAALYTAEWLYGKEVAGSLSEGLVIDWELSDIPHLVIEADQ